MKLNGQLSNFFSNDSKILAHPDVRSVGGELLTKKKRQNIE